MAVPNLEDLRPTFEDIARILLAAPTVEQSLDRITAAAVRVVDGCDHAAVLLLQKGEVVTRAATDEVAGRLEAIELETGQGPSLDTIRDHGTFLVHDLRTEARWPKFAERAIASSAVTSILSYRLFVEDDTYGALNLYSKVPGAFDAEAAALGAVLAAHSAVAMKMSGEVEHLNIAMVSRATIEQAKGIIMATTRCGPDRAFEILRLQSQALNEKLRDVAAEIVERQGG